MTFDLTQGQAKARAMVKEMVASERAAFGIISGYAGTGKTTMLKLLADDHGEPVVLAPTGKAALRVSEATGLQAGTIHRWIYSPVEDTKTGDVKFEKKDLDHIRIPQSRLIIVDESSMISEETWDDIWLMAQSLGLKVLLVGDPFQLPPVTFRDGEKRRFSALSNLDTPHRADLIEVVRQALDNPIIRASMGVRAGSIEAVAAVTDMNLIGSKELVDTFLLMDPASRALIAHKNDTRRDLNIKIRQALGYPELEIRPNEPLLVLQNCYKANRFNGEVVKYQGWTLGPGPQEVVRDRYKNVAMHMSFGVATVEGDTVILSQEEVFGQTGDLPAFTISKYAKDYARAHWGYKRGAGTPGYVNANLGHALTCHKSQGSEWQDVLVYAEPSVGGWQGLYSYEGRRWLYTAMTRAKGRVTICLD